MKVFAQNKKAYFDYEILKTYEAGIELLGSEVKSVKNGKISLKGAFVTIKDSELFLLNATISPYQTKNMPADYDPQQSRRLLLHKSEIRELIGKSKEKGLTLVPLRVYTMRGKIKVEIAVAKGKKKYEKKEKIKEKEAKREIEREIKKSGF